MKRLHRVFQLDLASGDFTEPVFSDKLDDDKVPVVPSLDSSTQYKWRCKDVLASGLETKWSEIQFFTTGKTKRIMLFAKHSCIYSDDSGTTWIQSPTYNISGDVSIGRHVELNNKIYADNSYYGDSYVANDAINYSVAAGVSNTVYECYSNGSKAFYVDGTGPVSIRWDVTGESFYTLLTGTTQSLRQAVWSEYFNSWILCLSDDYIVTPDLTALATYNVSSLGLPRISGAILNDIDGVILNITTIATVADTAMVSLDFGVSWTTNTLPSNLTITTGHNSAYGNDKYLVFHPNGGYKIFWCSSDDVTTWHEVTVANYSGYVFFVNGYFFIAGTDSSSNSITIRSSDCITWDTVWAGDSTIFDRPVTNFTGEIAT